LIFNYFKTEGKNLKVYFTHTGSGLMMKNNNNRTGFEIAGEDKKYYDANVVNYKNHLKLSSMLVKDPQYVRYAWSDTATATLFNIDGLPASPFSSEYK
jgi:sialate O-acetylesterase